jgi:dihydrofolate reductase
MGKIATGFTMSLDGFIADPQGEVGRLFDWYNSGDTPFTFPDGRMVVRVSAASADFLRELTASAGTIITGRKQFDIARGWGGRHPMDLPIFVVTHHVPPEWVYAGSPFTFVTDGIESALEQARKVAGDKDIAIDGANLSQQFIRAGRVDEIYIHLVPFLLGEGIRFFDHLGDQRIELDILQVVGTPDVTHLRYRVIR